VVTLTRMPSANPIAAPTPIAAPVLITRSIAQAQEGRPERADAAPSGFAASTSVPKGPRPQGATSGYVSPNAYRAVTHRQRLGINRLVCRA
jgi:hypothetical protein